MSVNEVQKAVLYTKEIQDIGLFAAMADSRFFLAFSASPLYFIMLPMIGLLISVLALINGYQLVKANNRTIDKWSQFLISSVCAVLASVSLYGAVVATALGLTFVAGPWLFFSSLLIASGHQLFMLGLNGYRAYECPQGSAQRMHYFQSTLNGLFILGLLSAVLGAVIFVMLLPIAPYVATACALTAAAFTVMNILWRLIPYNWKQTIKEHMNLGKPELLIQNKPSQSLALQNVSDSASSHEAKNHRLFTEVLMKKANPVEHQIEKILLQTLRTTYYTVIGSSNDKKHIQDNPYTEIALNRYRSYRTSWFKNITYTYRPNKNNPNKNTKWAATEVPKGYPTNPHFSDKNLMNQYEQYDSINRLFISAASVALSVRYGNCGVLTCYSAWLLWKFQFEHRDIPLITRIEMVKLDEFDHCLLVINRVLGFLDDDSTWGDCWIYDPWRANDEDKRVYRSNLFTQNMKALYPLDVKPSSFRAKLMYEISPLSTEPPSHLIEHIEFFSLDLTKDDIDALQKQQTQHQANIKKTVLPQLISSVNCNHTINLREPVVQNTVRDFQM